MGERGGSPAGHLHGEGGQHEGGFPPLLRGAAEGRTESLAADAWLRPQTPRPSPRNPRPDIAPLTSQSPPYLLLQPRPPGTIPRPSSAHFPQLYPPLPWLRPPPIPAPPTSLLAPPYAHAHPDTTHTNPAHLWFHPMSCSPLWLHPQPTPAPPTPAPPALAPPTPVPPTHGSSVLLTLAPPTRPRPLQAPPRPVGAARSWGVRRR